jgi:hypothetical protein
MVHLEVTIRHVRLGQFDFLKEIRIDRVRRGQTKLDQSQVGSGRINLYVNFKKKLINFD